MSDGLRLVFERPRFSKWGSRFTMGIVATLVAGIALSSWSFESKGMLGVFLVLCSPFLLLVWYRTWHRVELDASGITVVTPLGRRHTPWTRAMEADLPTYNWNEIEHAMPAELAGVEPLFELSHDARLPFRAAHPPFVMNRDNGHIGFRLILTTIAIRAAEPTGDWRRQLATVFAAHTAYNKPRAHALPKARAT